MASRAVACGRARRWICALVSICLLLTPAPSPVSARASAPGIAVAPAQITPGGVVLLAGAGFAAGEPVQLALDARPVALVTASPAGTLPISGVVVPPTLPVGRHSVSARGVRSGRRFSAALIVLDLSPALRVTSRAATPGSLVSVRGDGFLPREPVALALNGSALSPTQRVPDRPNMRAGADGSFDAQFAAPASMLAGANTVAATGATSHRTALATLIALLPVRTDFLFAGAGTERGERPHLAILNATAVPATIFVTLLPAAGSGRHPTTVRALVPPRSRADLDLAAAAGPGAQFGLRVRADRRVAATLVQTSPRSGARAVAPTGAARTTWLLAEGFTGLTFRESLALLNPDRSPARVRVQFLLANGQRQRLIELRLPPQRQVLVDVTRAVPRRSVAVVIVADRPIVAGRTLRFGSRGTGATTSLGSPIASSTWLFAAGSTRGATRTYLTVLNPGTVPAGVTASCYDALGRPLGNRTIRVDALHRGTILLNETLPAIDFATFVTSTTPVVVERPLYTGDPNGAGATGSVLPGANGASPIASFADGEIGPDAHESILLLNPTARTARLGVTFYPPAARRPHRLVRESIVVPPLALYTIDVAAALRGSGPGAYAALLTSTNGVGFVAEQLIRTVDGSRVTVRAVQALAQ